MKASDTYEPLADKFGLSREMRAQLLDDQFHRREWNNKVQWAREHLRKAGWLESDTRGQWTLTDSGRARAARLIGRGPSAAPAAVHSRPSNSGKMFSKILIANRGEIACRV